MDWDFEDLVLFGLLAVGLGTLLTGAAGGFSGGGVLQTISDSAVQAIAKAIALAEGFYVSGSIPQRANNPGDLVEGDIGNGTLGAGITVFATPEDGWNALYNQVSKMLNGTSHIYSPNMTIAQVAGKYTATQQTAWANNVSGSLGVSPDTTLSDIANQIG